MYVLDSPVRSLEILLGGAVATVEPHWTVHYRTYAKSGEESSALSLGVTTGGTAATMLAAPKAGARHGIVAMTIHNADSASVTVTVRINNDGAYRTIYKATLATLETLVYESGNGWTAYTTAGAIK